MEPRHFDKKDEDANEAPWGPERPAKKQDFVKPQLREAIERYRLARAARHGTSSPDGAAGGNRAGRANPTRPSNQRTRHLTPLLSAERALVTGVASGIGRGIARALHAEGARLAVVDIDAERGGNVASELGATFIQADLSTEAGARAAFDAATKRSARSRSSSTPRRRRAARRKPCSTVTTAEWDAMVNTNLRSGFVLSQAIAKQMIAEQISRQNVVRDVTARGLTPQSSTLQRGKSR